jgi:dolichol-phosphate mannosyltransferase
VPVNHRPRTHGQSKYGLTRTFKVLLDLATVWFLRGFATKPIYVFGGAAIALLGGAFCCDLFVAYRRLIDGVYVHLQPLFVISMVMALAALQLGLLGLLAEVAVRTYFESRGRPPYDIRRICGSNHAELTLQPFVSPRLQAAPVPAALLSVSHTI